MKRLLVFLLCIIFPISAIGEQERIFDNTNLLSEEDLEVVNAAILEFRKTTKTDLTILLTDDYLGPGSPSNIAEYFYGIMGFGIGPNKDGAIIYLDANTKTGGGFCIVGYGFWETLITEENEVRIANSILESDGKTKFTTRSSAFVLMIDEMLEIYNEYWDYWIATE